MASSIREGQIRIAQIREGQIRITQICEGQIRITQIRAAQSCALKAHSAHDEFRQCLAHGLSLDRCDLRPADSPNRYWHTALACFVLPPRTIHSMISSDR
jgi:hypothetical protein